MVAGWLLLARSTYSTSTTSEGIAIAMNYDIIVTK